MKVESQAGKFMLSFESMEPSDTGGIVIHGKMGVWEAETSVTLREFMGILRLTLTPRMLGFLLKAFFSGRLFAKE